MNTRASLAKKLQTVANRKTAQRFRVEGQLRQRTHDQLREEISKDDHWQSLHQVVRQLIANKQLVASVVLLSASFGLVGGLIGASL